MGGRSGGKGKISCRARSPRILNLGEGEAGQNPVGLGGLKKAKERATPKRDQGKENRKLLDFVKKVQSHFELRFWEKGEIKGM